MKKILIVTLVLLTLFCFFACNASSSITCPECGYKNSLGVKFCSDCGASMASSNGGNQNGDGNNSNDNNEGTSCQHSFGEWHEKVAASCTNTGTKERTCSKCSQKETETIAVLGHTTTTGVCGRCNQRIGWTKEELQNIVQIHDIYVDDINSAGGVDMRISWTNTSDKTIKYIHFYVVPYNAVGDQMYCDIRDYSRFDAYVTGPCEPGHQGYYKIGDIYYGNLWENCWYNNSIKTIQLVGIKIIYMDGSVIDIEEKDISKAFVEFSPLKEGYGIDEAFIEYYPVDENHRFYWAIDYLGVSVRPNVNIDVRIVNSNNVEVFYGEYYAITENYTEINMYGVNKWMIATAVYDNEIKVGNTTTGTLYYHIWSEDGTIDLGERSVEIDNLPVGNEEFIFKLNEDGQSYSISSNRNSNATTIAIPEQYNGKPVTKIDDFAFSYNESITNVTLSDNITSIGSYAFFECRSLANITIGKNVSSISETSLLGCEMLVNIAVSANNGVYQSINGHLYTKDGKILCKYANGNTNTTFSIPNGVEEIGESAFEGCLNLIEVILPHTVRKIGSYAFSLCDTLKTVRITNGITYIDMCAFYSCESLTSIHYDGTKTEWDNIDKYINEELYTSWDELTGDYIIYCTDGNIPKAQ